MSERDIPLKLSAQLDRMAEDVLTKFGDYGEYTRLRQDALMARRTEVAAQGETSTTPTQVPEDSGFTMGDFEGL